MPYPEWLAFHKRKWRIQRAERKRRRLMGISATSARARAQDGQEGAGVTSAGAASASTARGPVTMANYLANTAQRMNQMHWQILQIAETQVKGGGGGGGKSRQAKGFAMAGTSKTVLHEPGEERAND